MLALARKPSKMPRARRTRRDRLAPRVDACEGRLLMATGFLQGAVTVGTTGQGLAGATILLHRLDAAAADRTTTTDASGNYLFTGLDAGSYRLTETPPTGYVNASTEANSPLTPVTATTASSIDVRVGGGDGLTVSYPSHNKKVLTITNDGKTQPSLIGQSNITVNQPDIGSTSPLFSSICVDFFRDIFTGEQNLPYSMMPLSTALASIPSIKNPQNAGEIAYLYNHIASTWSTTPSGYVPVQEAAGFQLAIWELEYETSGTYNVLDGSFFAQGLTASSPEATYAQNFLNIAQGKDEEAVFLNGLSTSGRPGGSQGLIAPMMLNFVNAASPPAPGVTIQKFTNGVRDTDPNGSNLVIASPGAAITWTYDVANTGNVAFAKADVVVADSVDGLNPTLTGGDTNGNDMLDPGETWVYTATGTALDLSGTLPPSVVVVPGGDTGGTGATRPVYQNTGTVTITGTELTASDVSHYANPAPPPTPSVTIQKFTNGAHDTNPNGSDLVVLGPGAAVTWTYQVSNTGGVAFPKADVAVTDSVTGVTPAYTSGDVNNNGILDPNETWTYTATGTALDLSGTLPLAVKVVPGGDPNGTGNTRNVYENTGTVTVAAFSLTSSDVSHYANPAAPGITIQKLTNGVRDTDPNGNELVIVNPGAALTWTYDVANTGNVSFARANVAVSDSVSGVNPSYTSGDANGNGLLDPGETWVYTATGTALDLTGTLPPTVVVVPGGDPNGTGNTRNVYQNTGTVTVAGTSLAASDISHYANFPSAPPAPPVITIAGTVFHECNNNGVYEPALGETTLANVVVTLSGTDADGQSVSMTTTTDAVGHYAFDLTGLPGVYTVTMAVPSGYLDGKSTPGTAGGTAGTTTISNINLAESATGYNFAVLLPSSLSGVVYYDLNHDGAMGVTDFGIAHVVVTLTGTDDRGQAVTQKMTTGDDGTFSFTGLRPGAYQITRTQPGLFRRYQNTAGTLGGTATRDAIKGIDVPGCSSGTGYLFGELQQPTCRLRTLAFHVGRTFARQEAEYASNPTAFTRAHPNLAPSIAAGQIPWGKGTYPKASLARYWVPTLGTKVIRISDVYDRTKTAAARVTAKVASHAGAAKAAVVGKASTALRAVRNSATVKAAVAQASRVHAAIRRG
ncbi:Serine-aspartate repeat-containing protein D precursor [Aquisphaera giovannonii]|uniref:Serine-aspartate repeat-containing protein D n=1 Tax=Aquisphaera giovannonii TaxID=406548 RepID=A0A5B9WF82_9BACT|nr:SdrD B-like domain-containing protein [Aquisphaera giovannonii]QEH38894.1 Serine-aspartate repeat-containing protein D precursor [Aquisphaera giovannonii]